MMRMPLFRFSVKLLICTLFALLFAQVFFSCKKSDKVSTPMPAIAYKQKVISIAEDVAMTPVKPDSTGGVITEYNINPLLPKGLSLNKANGEISGTPSDTLAATKFVVTAKGPGGTAKDSITLLIGTVAFNYGPTGAFTLEKNSADLSVTPIAPVVLAGNFTQYFITPITDTFNFRTGLKFNTQTGQINGSPTKLTSTTEIPAPYTLVVTGIAGGKVATTMVNIYINDKKPVFSYPAYVGTFTKDTSVGNIFTPIATTGTGAVVKYRLAPNSQAIPAGLTLDSMTGKITGVPTVTGNFTLTVRGLNTGGYIDVNVPIVIKATTDLPSVYYTMAITSGNYIDTICSRIQTGNTIYLTKSDNIGNTPVYLNPVMIAGQVGTFAAGTGLPTGFSVPGTGIANGTPTAAAGNYSSTITINNAIANGVKGSFAMNLVVNTPFFIYNAEARGYNPNFFLFLQNQRVDVTGNGYTGYQAASLTPAIQGGAQIVSYAIYALAADKPFSRTGLIFNTTTGVISGTPVVSTEQNSNYPSWDYVVVGTKSDGSFTYYKIRIKIYPNMGVYGSV